jgi:hypothetical protein
MDGYVTGIMMSVVMQADEEEAMQLEPHGISIRFAGPGDGEAIERLAELDSARPAHGDTLVAEVDGRIAAALPLAEGRVIADPFLPTAELRSLLRVRARQLSGEVPAGRPLRTLVHALPVLGRHA